MIITRINPSGLTFTLQEWHPADVPYANQTKIRLSGTNKEMIIDKPLEVISAMWYKWQMQGMFVQNAFQGIPAEQQEFLMTGITPDEWNATFNLNSDGSYKR